ncbi:dTMP kinase [Thiomicrospira sp. ALE5]|uniref:dTMP kinase n=1 Tax=Thiomicrospira sp. ALE5 TaxID=748650 RepID=UPI0008F2CCB9|nr:dTMP kinase [Thiomicrospira sp. ALE5]SFR52116.1 dTMP kinase [Thiomicrospira sp. ALE5]
MTGKFIALEGGEGAGKSTNAQFIKQQLEARGLEVLLTREPGGTPLGEKVRAILLDATLPAMTPTTEALLMFAARAEHYAQVIAPALAVGQWVISDRFVDASFAYQGAARGLGSHKIAELTDWTLPNVQADLTLVFDLPVEVGMMRVQARGGVIDRFEQEPPAFFEQVRQAYLERAAKAPSHYCVLDASQDLSAVQRVIAEQLDRLCLG